MTDVSGAVCLSQVGGAIIAIDQRLTTLMAKQNFAVASQRTTIARTLVLRLPV